MQKSCKEQGKKVCKMYKGTRKESMPMGIKDIGKECGRKELNDNVGKKLAKKQLESWQ